MSIFVSRSSVPVDPSQMSYQCRDENLDHHGYCDGAAADGGRCMCSYCRHPRSLRQGGRDLNA